MKKIILILIYCIVMGLNTHAQQLVYSSFLGGSGNDATWWLDNMAVDENGNICLAIDTDSKDFPFTEDAYDKTYNGGNKWGMEDIAIVKFSIENNRLEYSSYFGGSGPEFVTQLFCRNDFLYLTGNHGSMDFPVTPDAYDNDFNGPDFRHADGFMSVFNKNELIASSHIGTTGNEGGYSISVNEKNNIVVTTQLSIPDELGLTNNYSEMANSDAAYACILLFNPKGDSLLTSLQLGMASSLSSVIDDKGYVYLAGSTSDLHFPVTSDVYDTDFNGGVKEWKGDFFVIKLSPELEKIIFSTYIGGSSDESYPKIVIDKDKNIVLFGITESEDYPLTENAYQSLRKGTRDFVLTKLSSDGKNILYSTLLGSNEIGTENNGEIAINSNDEICLSGSTDGTDFPVTQNAFQSVNNGKKDLFLTILSKDLEQIKYSTYLGGKEDDMLPSLLFTDDKNVVLCGTSLSPDFPVSVNTFCDKLNGNSDVVLVHFEINQ